MQIKNVPPIGPNTKLFDEVEKIIMRVFVKEIYLPLVKETRQQLKVHNSKDDLLNAIRSGRISFYRGEFKGKLNATLSRELKAIGATWDYKTQTFKLLKGEIPLEIGMAVSTAQSTFNGVQKRVLDKLNNLVPEEIAGKVALKQIFDASLFKMDQDFKKSIKGITVAPDITQTERENIATGYTQNLERYIQKFTDEQIGKLRQQVQESALAGQRYETLVDSIQKSFKVTKEKAKFLARQETKLMMASFKKSRYSSAGITQYKWKCVAGSKAHPVRPDHKVLDNTIHSYDDPPITDSKGNKNNPGEDFGCRCYDQPIVVNNAR